MKDQRAGGIGRQPRLAQGQPQWLCENEPALGSDLDVIAFVDVINPDGIPGSGDERFRALSSGGRKLVVGSADARKDRLATIVRAAVVIAFRKRMS